MLPIKIVLRYCPIIALSLIMGCDRSSAPAGQNPAPVENKDEEDNEDSQKPANETPPTLPTVPGTQGEENKSGGEASSPGGGGQGGGGGGGGGRPGGTSQETTFIGPNGVCGNGIQEVLPGSHVKCIYDLYGSTTDGPEGISSLYFIAKDTGVGYLIGAITENSVGVERIGALDFGADGTLYGVGERSSDDKSVFLSIDCETAQATIIGLTNIDTLYGSDAVISDIDIDSQGRIYAFSDSATDPNVLGLINESTGAFIEVGPAGVAVSAGEQGNGLASAPFASDTLYLAGETNLSSLDRTTGTATTVDGLEFFPPADSDPRISAMDHDAFTDITYVVINDPQLPPLVKNNLAPLHDSYVATIDRSNGTTSFLPLGPQLAPLGLDAIAVNQHYEECDLGGGDPQNIPPIPEGADCTEACLVFESDCADGNDNDSDGSIDCVDPDCADQACDDELACTDADICLAGVCVGTANPCVDENPCSVDGICNEPSGECDYSQLEARPNFGDCEVDGSPCTIGKCIDSEGPQCFEQNRALISIEDNGCLDDNPCTGDGCIEIPVDEGGPVSLMSLQPFEETIAQCVYDSLVGTLCQPDPESCFEGVCTLTGEGTPSSPYDIECLDLIPRDCDNK